MSKSLKLEILENLRTDEKFMEALKKLQPTVFTVVEWFNENNIQFIATNANKKFFSFALSTDDAIDFANVFNGKLSFTAKDWLNDNSYIKFTVKL